MRAARFLLHTAFPIALVACVGPTVQASLWTPPDFHVDVWQTAVDEEGVPRVARRFEVWADGLAAFREAERDVASPDGLVPLYDTICVYEMHPNSVRMLGRLLQRAGIMDAGVAPPAGRAPTDGDVTIRWSAFGDSGSVPSWSEDPVLFDRLLQVVNAFVPAGHEFDDPAGEKEPRHVADVPEPVRSVQGAIEAYQALIERRPDDQELKRELRALQATVGSPSAVPTKRN